MTHLVKIRQGFEAVEGMTISQRLDTSIHPVTNKGQYIEDVGDGEVTYFLHDEINWSFSAVFDIVGTDDDELKIKEVYLENDLIETTLEQRQAITDLATDDFRCTLVVDCDDSDYYDQATHGFRNSDFLYG